MARKAEIRMKFSSTYRAANIYLFITMNEPLTEVQEEFLIYEISDLVADLGGYLGLLLGASLYTIYELSEMLVEKFASQGRNGKK